jgi:hypothetical protein
VDNRRAVILAIVAGVAVIAIAWHATCESCQAGLRAQLRLAADIPPAPWNEPAVITGICPQKHRPHVFTGMHTGRHRMYHHPPACSPNMAQTMSEAWRFVPPAEGDL